MVRRRVDQDDAWVVRLALTAAGARRLAQLTDAHLAELAVLASTLRPLVDTSDERGYLRDTLRDT